MPRTIRFHLDEHVASAIAAGLRRQGVDITTTADAGLGGATDEEHLAYALPAGRVIVTQDDDYLRIHAAGANHAGVAYWAQNSRSIGEILRSLLLIWEIMEPEEMHNHIEFL